jgi:protein-disulfide isomerase
MRVSRIRTREFIFMPRLARLLVAITVLAFGSFVARADDGVYPIRTDDGDIIANHPISAELESRIEKLSGVVVAGNPHGAVTVVEFYDVNCGYCRQAAADIDALLHANPQLRLVLVPFPVLGIQSIQGTRVELAVARLAPAATFYKFHRMLDSARGVVDGNRAMAAAQAVGLDPAKVLQIANGDDLADIMKAHVRMGDELAIQATPGFVIKGVAIVGYPGPKAMAGIVKAVEKCGAVLCDAAAR